MQKIDLILLKYGEIALKGLNKPLFERKLLDNIKSRLDKVGKFSVRRAQSTVYVEPLDETADMQEALKVLEKIFGIVNICPVVKCAKDMDSIAKTAVECLESLDTAGKTFKVEAKREDKKFPLNSPQICMELGGRILDAALGLSVDVHNPEITVNVEVRQEAYVYTQKLKGAGGMPVGTNGKSTILLSGGIDSPVAGYMIAKRGVELEAVHFHSHPYTSDRAKEKVIDLAREMAQYCGKIRLHIVPFTQIQLDIIEKCPENYLTVIMRRIMMRIAEKVSNRVGSAALITGESIGQVASQTMESLVCTDNAVNIPVFRPLIGMDKEEIVTISKKIGTYETSILPYEDCCTIFVPKHPKTKPQLNEIIEAEKALENIEEMIDQAISEEEVLIIK
ncbi:MAG: tRNA 4-thiouridine(8) synthase ThiI [Ruminococcaceae bacterium]|nr:tRNA 4-thiouridine(8) synthase ThiI [Oscillospiraceae bacterium]